LIKSEARGAYDTYGREVRREFWWGNVKERDHLEDIGVDGTIVLQIKK